MKKDQVILRATGKNRSIFAVTLILGLYLLATAVVAEKAEETIEILLQTTQGNIVFELYPKRTPITVENFLQYVRDGHYDNTVVYRIESFLIQMGSKKPDLSDKPKRPPIENEADKGLKNERYTVGMARWGPHTADAEYYINTRKNAHLDFREKSEAGWGYVAFGKVVEGMHVVDAIAAIPTKEERRMNLLRYPVEEVLIRKVSLLPPEVRAGCGGSGKEKSQIFRIVIPQGFMGQKPARLRARREDQGHQDQGHPAPQVDRTNVTA